MYLIEGTVQTRALSAPVLEPLKGRDTTVRGPEEKMVTWRRLRVNRRHARQIKNRQKAAIFNC